MNLGDGMSDYDIIVSAVFGSSRARSGQTSRKSPGELREGAGRTSSERAGTTPATSGPPVFEWRWGYLAGILYLGVFASALAFTVYFRLIRLIGSCSRLASASIM